jgi:hypothetical protein
MEGRATLTTVLSTAVMNTANETVSKVNRFCLELNACMSVPFSTS